MTRQALREDARRKKAAAPACSNARQRQKLQRPLENHALSNLSTLRDFIPSSRRPKNWERARSVPFKKKHATWINFLIFYINIFFKSCFKTIIYLCLLNLKKSEINFIKLKACFSFIFLKKSSFRKII